MGTYRVGKLVAARSQLRTAIELWFYDADDISIHTLAYASYEVIHTLSKRNGRTKALLFDAAYVKDSDRKIWADALKKSANFFKHADRDLGVELTFNTEVNEWFIFYSVIGLATLTQNKRNAHESAFLYWLALTKPHLLTDAGRRFFADPVGVKQLQNLRSLQKADFLEAIIEVRSVNRNKANAKVPT